MSEPDNKPEAADGPAAGLPYSVYPEKREYLHPSDVVNEMDPDLEQVGMPTYTHLAELLNDMVKPDPDPRTARLVADALAILNREMKLDRP